MYFNRIEKINENIREKEYGEYYVQFCPFLKLQDVMYICQLVLGRIHEGTL